MIIITDEMKQDFKECARLFHNLNYLSSTSIEQVMGAAEILERQSKKIAKQVQNNLVAIDEVNE